jgi:hypothetical protein
LPALKHGEVGLGDAKARGSIDLAEAFPESCRTKIAACHRVT